MNRILFGIDIGGTTIKCGIFSYEGKLLKKEEIPTDTQSNGRYILSDIAEYIKKTASEYKLNKEDIRVGLTVPGSVREDGVVNKCVNLGWGIVDAARDLAQLLEVRQNQIGVINDANAAALGEYWLGGGKDARSLIFVTVGTGVGGGLIVDGKCITGVNGAAAEIGHMPIAEEVDYPCTCGKTGCLEQVASARGIARLGKKNNAKEVFDAAKDGDKEMIAVVDKVAYYLAKGLACCAAVIDPEVFIIGGGVSAAGDFFIEKIRTHYRAQVFHPSIDTRIEGALLGNDAGMYGAAKLALDTVIR